MLRSNSDFASLVLQYFRAPNYYEYLWEERSVCSVANLTRRDGEEFLALAPRVPVRAEVRTFPLTEANEVLSRLRAGKIQGAAVLVNAEKS